MRMASDFRLRLPARKAANPNPSVSTMASRIMRGLDPIKG